jgi:polyhydroxybutyrate depolymerase
MTPGTHPPRRLGGAIVAVVAMVCGVLLATPAIANAGPPDHAKACSTPKPVAAGTTSATFEFNGAVRSYQLDIPKSYNGRHKAPVVVNLHGTGSTPQRQNDQTRMPELAGGRGYVVVAPAAAGSFGWNIVPAFSGVTTPGVPTPPVPTGEDVGFVNALMDHLESELCLDTSREYITGMSSGAGMATWIVCQPDSRFAAAAPVAGLNMGIGCPSATLPPFITFHGDNDNAMPYEGQRIFNIPLPVPSIDTRATDFALRQGCQAEPRTTTLGPVVEHKVWKCPPGAAAEVYKILGGGHVWPGSGDNDTIDATRVMLSFFASHKL